MGLFGSERRREDMAKLNRLLTLESMLEKYDGLDIEDPRDVVLRGQFVSDLVDEIIAKLNRHINSKTRLSCNKVLLTNFDTMTDARLWLKSRLFRDLPKEDSKRLKEKMEEMVDLIKTLLVKIINVDPDYADRFIERLRKRCKKYRTTDYDLWKARQNNLTIDQLVGYQTELTADMLMKGILEYDDDPRGEEVMKVDKETLMKKLKNRKDLPKHFEDECAKLRRYGHWEGDRYVIDYQLLRNYLFRIFRLLDNDQRIALFEYDVQMKQIHEDIMKMLHEEREVWKEEKEPTEELFHYIHPSLDDEEGWKIHNEVKRLVMRQSIPEICKYLRNMASEKKILLPQMSSSAYVELVRIGMPQGEGFGEKYFNKQYNLI